MGACLFPLKWAGSKGSEGGISMEERTVPQGLKPKSFWAYSARLKSRPFKASRLASFSQLVKPESFGACSARLKSCPWSFYIF
jgi:hypothetical protein